MKQRVLLAMLAMATLVACKKNDGSDPPNAVAPPDALAPEGFNFVTSKKVAFELTLLTNNDQPLSGILVNVYSTNPARSLLFSGFSDATGRVAADLNIPAYLDSLIIDPSYVGLMRDALAVVANNSVKATLGGKAVYSGDILPSAGGINGRVGVNTGHQSKIAGATVVSYFDTYDNKGRPTNMVQPDILSSELLSYVNTSLPESRAVPSYHPEYLSNSAVTNLNIVKSADVWITFVHEGAGYLNSLGFYTYPTNAPPQSISDIDSIKIAIPNASLFGSGGGMRAGDKIYLGRFAPGVSIGFVLLQNAWSNASRKVNANAPKYFADDILNNEKSTFKRHTVLLYDNKHQLFLTGFEDLQRDNNASDNDFNDLVFYATSNPVDAISNHNVKLVDTPTDTDNDGISDVYDKFPTDPTRALIQHFPTDETWGTLAFEDMWPNAGDYDMNDLVVNYHYTNIANGQNKSVELLADYTVRSVGATLKNGFGVQLPISSDKVSSVTGQRFTANYITTAANGTEAGQSKAVIVPFDDPKALINTSGVFVNVYNGRTYVNSDTARLKITFTAPVAASELGMAPYNPFLIAGQRRGYEIHLPGNKPTDKADLKLFGTQMDRSSVAGNKYYLTSKNWPWALGFLEPFDYPLETSKITSAYTNFQKWTGSAGANHSDWYLNKTGYRIPDLIFKK